jgi:hypothetical protein
MVGDFAFASQLIHGLVMSDAENPRRYFREHAEITGFFPDLHEHVIGQFLGRFGNANQPQKVAKQAFLVLAIEFFKSLAIPVGDLLEP